MTKQCKLADISIKTYSGLTGKTKKDFGHGKAKYITYMNVHDNAVANFDGIDKIEIDTKQNEVIKNDLLFTVSSEVPEEVAYNSVWPFNDQNVYLNSFCFGIRPQLNKVNSFFLTYYLRSPQMRKTIFPLAQGISRFNISKKNILNLNIEIPGLEEQNDIYKTIRSVEYIIYSYQNKFNQLTTIKKFLLQKLFV